MLLAAAASKHQLLAAHLAAKLLQQHAFSACNQYVQCAITLYQDNQAFACLLYCWIAYAGAAEFTRQAQQQAHCTGWV